jgi:predicted DNA-binding transcriptional regulator AlpA
MRVPLEQAASICGVKPATIYRWVADKRIRTYPSEEEFDARNWYDVTELLAWVDARNPDALGMRAGMAGEHARRMARVAVAKRELDRVSSALDESA